MTEMISIDSFHQQANELVLENRRLRAKSEADDATIVTLKSQYDELAAGVENLISDHKFAEEQMLEEHRKHERELMFRADRAERAYKEIEGLLLQAGNAALLVNELIVQATRARVGDVTPETMPKAELPVIDDARLPATSIY